MKTLGVSLLAVVVALVGCGPDAPAPAADPPAPAPAVATRAVPSVADIRSVNGAAMAPPFVGSPFLGTPPTASGDAQRDRLALLSFEVDQLKHAHHVRQQRLATEGVPLRQARALDAPTLLGVAAAAISASGADAEIIACDCSEYPCLVHARIKSGEQSFFAWSMEMQKRLGGMAVNECEHLPQGSKSDVRTCGVGVFAAVPQRESTNAYARTMFRLRGFYTAVDGVLPFAMFAPFAPFAPSPSPPLPLRMEITGEMFAALEAEKAYLQAQLAKPLSWADIEGEVFPFPEGHTREGDDQELRAAIETGLRDNRQNARIEATDCSEYPCLATVVFADDSVDITWSKQAASALKGLYFYERRGRTVLLALPMGREGSLQSQDLGKRLGVRMALLLAER